MNNTQRLAAGAGFAVLATAVIIPLGGGAGISANNPVGVGKTFPVTGTVPVVVGSSNSVIQMEIQKHAVSLSRTPKNDTSKTTLKSATPKPKISPSTVRSALKSSVKVTTIGSYRNCSGFAQSCIDKGYLTWYWPGAPTLAGHNYMGYQWLSRLPVGRVVKVTSGPLKGTYRVYDHAWSKRAKAGGQFPAKAERADLVLQTCEPSGTGFSLLRRV